MFHGYKSSAMIVIIVFMISLTGLAWIFLTILGMNKGPVLATFERYGGEDPLYYPWPWLLLWSGILIISVGMMMQDIIGSILPTNTLGVFMLICAYLAMNLKPRIRKHLDKLPVIPRWYGKLSENTSRYERRRIAYMWLHLPLRTRLLYNASDHFFFLWADLVIMATVRDS